MSESIEVKLDASEKNRTLVLKLKDLGLTVDEWNNMSEVERTELIVLEIEHMYIQPYWNIESFRIK